MIFLRYNRLRLYNMVVTIPIGYIVLMWSKNVFLSLLKSISLPSRLVTLMVMLEIACHLPIRLSNCLDLMERQDPGGLS